MKNTYIGMWFKTLLQNELVSIHPNIVVKE